MTIDFNTDYILENERVLLRPLSRNDFDNLLEFSEKEPEIWEFSTQFSNAAGKENLKNYIDYALSCREKKTEYPFVVFDKLSNSFAGSTRFYNISETHSTLEIGYTWYGKNFQRTGLNKNCKFLLLDFAFEQLKVERVGFVADNNNQKSIAAMKSIGCTVEGLLRSNFWKKNGERRDSIVLSIIKEDWETTVKNNLKEKITI